MKKYTMSERGNALIFALIIVVVLGILGSALLTKALTEYRAVERQKRQTELFFLAEGAMEDAIARFKFAIANFQILPETIRYPDVGELTTVFSPAISFPAGATASWNIAQAEPGDRIVNDPDGLGIRVKNYVLTATVIHPLDPGATITLHKLITRRLIYTFQHAVFYEDDLELLPGPTMTFSGRIHANDDIYIDTHNTLTIDSEYLRSVGKIFNQRKDDGSQLAGDVLVKKAGTANFFAMNNLDSESATWKTESQTRWGGTVKCDVHGVNKITAPSVGSIQPGGYYNSNAAITIENNVIKKNGVPLVPGVDIPPGTVVTDTDFYNNREGKAVKMTNIDVGKLGGGTYSGVTYANQLPSNGLLYATRNDFAGMQPGVRLVNGAEVKRNGGLTVVSDAPVYIQGNYNTVAKKPTAVICDAVNILSVNWNDATSGGGLAGRTAASTTVNTAYIAGINTTTSGNYNGGLENYPRFHENWTGKNLNLRGSFVELWNSAIGVGAWEYGGTQYTAPNRNWNYDTDFQSGSMPPFTPWAVEIAAGAWWE